VWKVMKLFFPIDQIAIYIFTFHMTYFTSFSWRIVSCFAIQLSVYYITGHYILRNITRVK